MINDWKITFKDKPKQIELRKTFKSSGVLIILSNEGYIHKHYKPDNQWNSTKDFNIHFSLNGPLQLTWADWEEINQAIDKAKAFLNNAPDTF